METIDINNKCYGCGVTLQFDDQNADGYAVRPSSDKPILCKRCYRMQHYNELSKAHLNQDDFLKILNHISSKDALFVYVVDLFDFSGSMIQGLSNHMKFNDVIVIANKRDILPKSLKDIKIEHWVRRQLNKEHLKPLDVLVMSALKNSQLDAFIELVEKRRADRDVYIIGATNVGKSTLINSLVRHFSEEGDGYITTSAFPGTTLDLIKIPLDDKHVLYDTPGLLNKHQMIYQLPIEQIGVLLPKKELKPVIFQLENNQTLFFENLVRLDYMLGEAGSMVCMFPPNIKIHRTKTINADKFIQNNKEVFVLQPLNSQKKSIVFNDLMDKDIVISGFGFIAMKGHIEKVMISIPTEVEVFIRDSLI